MLEREFSTSVIPGLTRNPDVLPVRWVLKRVQYNSDRITADLVSNDGFEIVPRFSGGRLHEATQQADHPQGDEHEAQRKDQ